MGTPEWEKKLLSGIDSLYIQTEKSNLIDSVNDFKLHLSLTLPLDLPFISCMCILSTAVQRPGIKPLLIPNGSGNRSLMAHTQQDGLGTRFPEPKGKNVNYSRVQIMAKLGVQ